MTLFEMLNTTTYFQQMSVYITNAYDQNLLIGRGVRKEIVDEEETSVFSHLMDEVDRWCVRDNRMIIFIRDKHYEERVENQFKDSINWGKEPEKRPWRHSIETEEYTDKYIREVLA